MSNSFFLRGAARLLQGNDYATATTEVTRKPFRRLNFWDDLIAVNQNQRALGLQEQRFGLYVILGIFGFVIVVIAAVGAVVACTRGKKRSKKAKLERTRAYDGGAGSSELGQDVIYVEDPTLGPSAMPPSAMPPAAVQPAVMQPAAYPPPYLQAYPPPQAPYPPVYQAPPQAPMPFHFPVRISISKSHHRSSRGGRHLRPSTKIEDLDSASDYARKSAARRSRTPMSITSDYPTSTVVPSQYVIEAYPGPTGYPPQPTHFVHTQHSAPPPIGEWDQAYASWFKRYHEWCKRHERKGERERHCHRHEDRRGKKQQTAQGQKRRR